MTVAVEVDLSKVEETGRVTIPTEYRKKLGERFIATRGLDKEIMLFLPQDWEAFFSKYVAGNNTDPLRSKAARILAANAFAIKQDSQGRMMIPQVLRNYAGITDEVCFTGTTKRIELWDAKTYETYRGERI